jgi:hypothetical protein
MNLFWSYKYSYSENLLCCVYIKTWFECFYLIMKYYLIILLIEKLREIHRDTYMICMSETSVIELMSL